MVGGKVSVAFCTGTFILGKPIFRFYPHIFRACFY
jgi:hypothetical protein